MTSHDAFAVESASVEPWTCGPATLHTGDALSVLTTMPNASVDCLVSSPPYWGMRDYLTGAWRQGQAGCRHERAPSLAAARRAAQPRRCPDCQAVWVDQQHGLEPTLAGYIDRLVAVFAEARRVLHPAGTLWLNLGDSYATGETGRRDAGHRYPRLGQHQPERRDRRLPQYSGLPRKNLLGLPWRIAFALQREGWILRNAVVWAKNAMPESVRDRLSTSYEMIFLLVRGPQYYFDLDAIRIPATGTGASRRRRPPRSGAPSGAGLAKYATAEPAIFAGRPHGAAMLPGHRHDTAHPKGKNPGSIWPMSTRPLKEAHFAAFPIDLPLRCITAGCRPGGTVLDVFSGTATTGLAALQLGRRYVGIELNPEYNRLAQQRISHQLHRGLCDRFPSSSPVDPTAALGDPHD
ncbi:MAG: site-specific DNA-methyltransferase [Micromonosporaceae bacterium]|nr:site-specific DNA-methyltransferase [Micromonosporaceae bacterium]